MEENKKENMEEGMKEGMKEDMEENTDERKDDTGDKTRGDSTKSEEGTEKTDTEKTSETKDKEDPLEVLKKDNANLKDQLLRKAADFDNYRKRMIKEKQEAIDYANATLLGDLLESLDNLDRAAAAGEGVPEAKAITDGVVMASKALVSTLENKYNLTSFGAVGDEFDPTLHEALRSVLDDGAESTTIKEVYLKGYKLRDRVIRHAKVAVTAPNK